MDRYKALFAMIKPFVPDPIECEYLADILFSQWEKELDEAFDAGWDKGDKEGFSLGYDVGFREGFDEGMGV